MEPNFAVVAHEMILCILLERHGKQYLSLSLSAMVLAWPWILVNSYLYQRYQDCNVGVNYAGVLLSSIWHSQLYQRVGRPLVSGLFSDVFRSTCVISASKQNV